MNTYASVRDFHAVFPHKEADDSELNENLLLASLRVDELTFGRIKGAGLQNLTPSQRESIKQAVIRQAKYTLENGAEGENSISAYTVGSLSVTASNGETRAQRLKFDPLALKLLDSTGLTGRVI